jgi:CheY-like chemotaxis protein
VGVFSKPGSGSTFWFTAVLNSYENAKEQSYLQTSDHHVQARHPDFSRIQGAKILVVEDNEINQEVVTQILASAGFRVNIAKNGLEAVEMVSRENDTEGYHLILMDVQMPVMDGLTATKKILSLPGCEQLPILALTANVLREDRNHCLSVGMKDFLTKPIQPAELWAALNRWCLSVPARNGFSENVRGTHFDAQGLKDDPVQSQMVKQQAGEILGLLMKELEYDDTVCIQTLKDNEGILIQALGRDFFKLKDWIDQFEFEKAYLLVKDWTEKVSYL